MKKIRKQNLKLLNRLYNYKFNQALLYLNGESEEVKEDIQILSRLFGDIGWTIEGDIGKLISRVLESLGVEEEYP